MSLLATHSNEPIPGYHLGHRLGAGGYGEVWTVEAPGGLTKAIKFVYGLLDEDRASRELKALNRIKGVRHPFLLSLERIEVIGGQLVIVTELADCSLKERFEACHKEGGGGISRDELLNHLRDAADALDFMNEQHSLQHLDVKPENLLLVGGRIKVADFGLVKDLAEISGSLMGGLTPIYAPPEVFEGRPSRRSDQYSLAIVYQEMLTGTLPFPGRTAAQLAAQHLNARPRISTLPAADQVVIARGLSKKPDERFSNCREMVDALLHAGLPPAAGSAASPAATLALDSSAAGANNASPGSAQARLASMMPAGATEPPRTPGDMLNDLHAATAGVEALEGSSGGEFDSVNDGEVLDGRSLWQASELEEPSPAVDLPPVELAAQACVPRPTLFIGIGGAAARALQKLRRRLDDRVAEADRSLYSMLLLDTDQHDLLRATHGEDGAALAPSETLHLPLRKTQDYRNDSRKILEWLSRRWLYNIPRSLQTEGMRPLGRLALVDHADRVHVRLREGMKNLFQQARQSSSVSVSQPVGASDSSATPRIILVSSISGGAGSGMVVDVIYAIRQALDELGNVPAEVGTLLLHGTNRNPQQQELAVVNARACLAELNQFMRPGGSYPGDIACGMKPRPSHATTLDYAYLVHLGEELGPTEFDSALDRMAEFLLLDSATPAAGFFQACRQAPLDMENSRRPEVLFRTLALRQFGFSQDSIVTDAVQSLCETVLQRWSGVTRDPSRSTIRKLALRDSTVNEQPADNRAAQADARAAEWAKRRGLDADATIQHVYVCAGTEMEGDVDEVFGRIVASVALKEKPEVAVQKWLDASADLFSRRPEEADAPVPPPTALQEAIQQRALKVVPRFGKDIREWLLALAEEPGTRIAGAQRAAKWLSDHLNSVAEKLREMQRRFALEANHAERLLVPAEPQKKSRAARPNGSELAGLFTQYCRLRLFETSADVGAQICQALQSHIATTTDSLLEVARDLKHLGQQLVPAHSGNEESTAGDELATLRESVAEALRLGNDESAALIDENFTLGMFADSGGIRDVLLCNDKRQAFLKQFYAQARQAVLARLQAIDLAAMLLGDESQLAGGEQVVRNSLKQIQPALQICGGQRRLLCVLPDGRLPETTSASLAERLGTEHFQQAPTIVRDASSDVVLLMEMGGISLHQAAAALIDFRLDLADVASRLHTRNDVNWQPLLMRE